MLRHMRQRKNAERTRCDVRTDVAPAGGDTNGSRLYYSLVAHASQHPIVFFYIHILFYSCTVNCVLSDQRSPRHAAAPAPRGSRAVLCPQGVSLALGLGAHILDKAAPSDPARRPSARRDRVRGDAPPRPPPPPPPPPLRLHTIRRREGISTIGRGSCIVYNLRY